MTRPASIQETALITLLALIPGVIVAVVGATVVPVWKKVRWLW